MACLRILLSILGLQEDVGGCRRLLEKGGGWVRALGSYKRKTWVP